MQDKLPQELLNERAALDWELQQHQAEVNGTTDPVFGLPSTG